MPAHAEPHIPVGRLDDGTPVYASPGRLTAVDGWRRVRCHARPARHPRARRRAIAAELGASRRTVRRLLDQAAVPRQTSLTQATAADGRLARVAELGFPDDLPGYLRQR